MHFRVMVLSKVFAINSNIRIWPMMFSFNVWSAKQYALPSHMARRRIIPLFLWRLNTMKSCFSTQIFIKEVIGTSHKTLLCSQEVQTKVKKMFDGKRDLGACFNCNPAIFLLTKHELQLGCHRKHWATGGLRNCLELSMQRSHTCYSAMSENISERIPGWALDKNIANGW